MVGSGTRLLVPEPAQGLVVTAGCGPLCAPGMMAETHTHTHIISLFKIFVHLA